MLTPNAMTGIKDYVKRTVSYAMYKVGPTYYRAEIGDIYIDSGGKVVIDFVVNPPISGSATVTQVQLYDTGGAKWLEKTENITRKSSQRGIFFRFTIDIREV